MKRPVPLLLTRIGLLALVWGAAACGDPPPESEPLAPTGVTFTAGEDRVTIAFTAPTAAGFDRVVIQRGEGAAPTSLVSGTRICDPCASPVIDTGVTAGTAAGYAVYALYTGDRVSPAVTGTATATGVNVAPGPVTGATFVASDHQIALAWTNPPDADLAKVIIRRAVGAAPPDAVIAGDAVCDPCTSPFVDGDLTNDVLVSYAIFAVDNGGLVSAGVIGSATPVVAPGPVTDATFVGGDHEVTIDWIDPPDPDLARVVIRRAAGTVPPDSIIDGDGVCDPCTPPFVDGDLTNDVLVSYAIFAVDESALISAAVTGSATPVVAPGPVTNTAFVGGDHTVSIGWTNPPDLDLARIVIRRALGATPPASITDGESVCDPCTAPYDDSGLANDVLVSYAIFAVDEGGLLSAGVTGSATPVVAPGPVTDVTFVAGIRHVSIGWIDPPDSDLAKVVIRRALGATPPASITDGESVCDPCTAPHDDVGLDNDVLVSYALFAVDHGGLVSVPTTGAATPVAPPGPVTGATFDAGNHQVTIAWTNPTDLDLAKIVIRRVDGVTPPATIDAGQSVCDPCSSPHIDPGLGNGTTVAYAIFATDHGGLVSPAVTGSALPLPPFGLPTRPPNANCHAFTPPPTTGAVQFVDRFPGIALVTPVGLFQRLGDNTRWYVTERAGRIVYFPNDPGATAADLKVALDLRDVTYAGSDCSMGSLAFPPDFASSKHAYVGYCYLGPATGNRLQLRYSRFASSDGGATFDRASEELIVALDFPAGDGVHTTVGLHAADVARFGGDGYLYLSVGDGGPQGRTGGIQAQNLGDLRGKLLRIDVSDLTMKLDDDGFVPGRQRVAALIPPDNPFAGGGGEPEIYAYGFRNPWQWHFDRANGDIWLGDVGNNVWEEINRAVQSGGNYGWGYLEATHCTNGWSSADCANPVFRAPFLEYRHGNSAQEGNAVTGGVVYRGTGVPSMTGSYIFGDSSGGRIWAVSDVDDVPPGTMPGKTLLVEGAPVSSFAEDQDGELFATILYPTAAFPQGKILALEGVPAGPGPGSGGPPALLSQTGCFDAGDVAQPAADLVPFAPAAELWSDGAGKRRWMVVPDGQKITVHGDGDFAFPTGSVLVKEFSLAGKRVETRFLVRQEVDGRWAGYSYQWNDAETDATLVPAGGAQVVVGTQTWFFPSRGQCSRCHTKVAGDTLGPEVGQLNHVINYPQTGIDANQMDTLDHVGLLDLTAYPQAWSSYPRFDDDTRPVEERARAYLHVNCSNCHRPDGPTFTPPDFRFGTSFANTSVCNVEPTISALEDYIPSDPKLLAPGAPERSVLHVRLSTVDAGIRMPPLARALTDPVGTDLVGRWIEGITSCAPTP